MKALILVLAFSALAVAGPAFNNKNTESYGSYGTVDTIKQTPAIETLQHWCYSSQMSQNELTASFKKLVGIVKAQPEDTNTEVAVMSERICQQVSEQQKQQLEKKQQQQPESGNSWTNQKGADSNAHELIKDVYMDSLMACESRECMQQLLKIVNSNKVDTVRASYYMTRLAVTDKESIKDEVEVKQLTQSFLNEQMQPQSEAIERQKLLAVAATIGKSLKVKQESGKNSQELKEMAIQVAKTIVERYIKPVSSQEVQRYKETSAASAEPTLCKKIAKRNAGLKALANIPGWVLAECPQVQQVIVELVANKDELSTVRQSAIECLEQNEQAISKLKQVCFDQSEPTEVRIAAYRALMTTLYAGDKKDEQSKQQIAAQIVDELVKHCERNQEQDEQFCVYVISHLDNVRTSQQVEYQAIKECISKNKQHYMQIQLLCKKFQQKLADVRKFSRNYKLEQEFNHIESGLILEGDMIFADNTQADEINVLPKLVRVNMSMPVMGETVNMVEITIRQDQMDEQLMGALKLVQNTKFSSESVSKVVDTFKQSASGRKQQQQQQAEADLTIKVDGCTVAYICLDDFKSETSGRHQRNTRSVGFEGFLEQVIDKLQRRPIAFNRGINFSINERIAKLLDIEASLVAGLRLDARAQGQSADNFEIAAQIEPRFAFEALVGPAKMSEKKLLQRASTKSALGLRLRFKEGELIDVQIDLPMQTMELFTIESQMVESWAQKPDSYRYRADSIYGQEDIYAPLDELSFARKQQLLSQIEQQQQQPEHFLSKAPISLRKFKSNLFSGKDKSIAKFLTGKTGTFAHSFETHDQLERATGLRGKLRVAVSPKDMSFLCQCLVHKLDSQMEGIRVQLQKIQRGQEQQQWLMAVSTPGSRTERQVQVRLAKQSQGNQRSQLKAELVAPKLSVAGQLELVHDQRQLAVKAELVGQRGIQMRHSVEFGVQRGSQSAPGRVGATYKPFVSVQSSWLKRPIQMQGVVSYQQQPKTVISYEFKCPTSGNFVQGKFIVDTRANTNTNTNTGSYNTNTNSNKFAHQKRMWRRSMSSPIELVLDNDLTLTGEIVASVEQHVVRVHQMLDWDSQKWAVQFEGACSHKNVRKTNAESSVQVSVKVDPEQQQLSVARKSPQWARNEFRFVLASDTKVAKQHQFQAELRYNTKRQSNLESSISYKHKLDCNKMSGAASNKLELGYAVELIASEWQIAEKLQGRVQSVWEHRDKQIVCELAARDKQAKLELDWQSVGSHKASLVFQGQQWVQRVHIRSAKGEQVSVQSRTEKRGQLVSKLVAELSLPAAECQLIVELPGKQVQAAVELKLASGKLSSWAVQSPRFASKAEFSFESIARIAGSGKRAHFAMPKSLAELVGLRQLRLKTDLKDVMSKDAYWLDSALSMDNSNESYLRMDSPIYRTDVAFSPLDKQARVGIFARNKRSIDNYSKLYSLDESAAPSAGWIDTFHKTGSGMELGNKLWALRSIIGKFETGSAKQAVLRNLFKFANERQQYRHSLDWAPRDQSLKWMLEHDDLAKKQQQQQPQRPWLRFAGDLSPKRASQVSMDSELADFELNAQPFDGDSSWAKLSVVSRHPRSLSKKCESEIRYERDHGYKAWMKHEGKDGAKSFDLKLAADKEPQKWAQMDYQSDKHAGKYQHNWRKHVTKRSVGDFEQDVYNNQVAFEMTDKLNNDWAHSSRFDWQEPTTTSSSWSTGGRNFALADYLKRVNGRVNSLTKRTQGDTYKLDFDFEPQLSRAKLDVHMLPDDMLHSSVMTFKPDVRQFALDTKYVSRRTQEPVYKLQAATKPFKLATGEQQPAFIEAEHPMLARPISDSLVANIFKQPMKLDYSDKSGRQARLDYDQSPVPQLFGGIRYKRAAVSFKDADFEHDATYDFVPELALAGYNKQHPLYKQQIQQQQQQPIVIKSQTKAGPVAVLIDSNDDTCELKLVSPIVSGKIVAQDKSRSAKLITVQLDNKQQQVSLAKIVRKTPIIKHCDLVQKAAKSFDEAKFEHQSEILVDIVEQIFKLKSLTTDANDKRQPIVAKIEAELNRQQDKLIVKLDGKRTEAELAIDLVSKTANMVFNVDDKRTIQHQTRLVRTTDKIFELESVTTYKQKPIAKIVAKIPAKLFKPRYVSGQDCITTFEATLYKPEPYQISGMIDCGKMEASVIFKNLENQKVQESFIKYDTHSDTILVEARLAGNQRGQIYASKAKINIPGLIEPKHCRSQACQSEVVYQDKSGNWAVKVMPGDYITIKTPTTQKTINWVF